MNNLISEKKLRKRVKNIISLIEERTGLKFYVDRTHYGFDGTYAYLKCVTKIFEIDCTVNDYMDTDYPYGFKLRSTKGVVTSEEQVTEGFYEVLKLLNLFGTCMELEPVTISLDEIGLFRKKKDEDNGV
jgi:hypothetical protein